MARYRGGDHQSSFHRRAVHGPIKDEHQRAVGHEGTIAIDGVRGNQARRCGRCGRGHRGRLHGGRRRQRRAGGDAGERRKGCLLPGQEGHLRYRRRAAAGQQQHGGSQQKAGTASSQ